MICALTGTVEKLAMPQLCMTVQDVGYLVMVPVNVWEQLTDGERATVWIVTYVREDKLDLYGFATKEQRLLFSELTNVTGIGPKSALEICAIPADELLRVITDNDAKSLSKVKGIGAKKAEKIMPDLTSISEKHPHIFAGASPAARGSSGDDDAITALTTLGYERSIVLDALRRLPQDLTRTEDRVAAVLRSL